MGNNNEHKDDEHKLVIREDTTKSRAYLRLIAVFVVLEIPCIVGVVLGQIMLVRATTSGTGTSGWGLALLIVSIFLAVILGFVFAVFRVRLQERGARIIVGTQRIKDATVESEKVPETECKRLVFKAHKILKDSGGGSEWADVKKYILENDNVEIQYEDGVVSGRRLGPKRKRRRYEAASR